MRIVYSKRKKSLAERLNSPFLTLAVLAMVIGLGAYSYPRYDMHGNTREEVNDFYNQHLTADETLIAVFEGE